jgi:hypothetical protein
VDVNQQPQTLDYAKPQERDPIFLEDIVVGLFVGRLRSRWFYLQAGYYILLWGWLVGIAIWFGPNLFNFGRLTRPTPAEYVEQVQRECVPIVRAIKEFQRDNGRFPQKSEELVPKYLKKEPEYYNCVTNGNFSYCGKWYQAIVYDFRAGREGWYVYGQFTNGKIPVEPVKLAATPPTTQQK